MGEPYSEEEAKETEKLWREGYSASQIASILGNGRTRNSVIGFVHRNFEYPPRKNPRAPTRINVGRQPKQFRGPAAAATKRVEPAPIPSTAGLPPLLLPIEDVKPGQCRYACNDARSWQQHLFCGHPVAGESPYCAEHHKLCYVPAIERTRRKRANVLYMAGL